MYRPIRLLQYITTVWIRLCILCVLLVVDSSTPNFSLVGAGKGHPQKQKWKFYAISEYKRPAVSYALRDFYEIFRVCGMLRFRLNAKIWGFAQVVPEFCGLQLGVRFPQIFSALTANPYVERENVSEVQEWYGPLLSPCRIWWRWDFASSRRGRLGLVLCLFSISFFLSIMLLNDKDCERHFAMNAFE